MPPPPPDKIKFEPAISPKEPTVIFSPDNVTYFFPFGEAGKPWGPTSYKYVKSQSVKGVYYIFPDKVSNSDVESIVARADFERSKAWKTPTGRQIYDTIEQRSDLISEYSKAAPWDYRVAMSSRIKLPDDAVVGVHVFTTDTKNEMGLLYCHFSEDSDWTFAISSNISESNLDLTHNVAQSEFLNYDRIGMPPAAGKSGAKDTGFSETVIHEDVHVSRNITGYDCATPDTVSNEGFFIKAREYETQEITAKIAYEYDPKAGGAVSLGYPDLEMEFPGPYIPSSDPNAVGMFLTHEVTRTQTDFIRKVSNSMKHGRPDTPTLDETRTLSTQTPSSTPRQNDFFDYVTFNDQVIEPLSQEINEQVYGVGLDLNIENPSDSTTFNVTCDGETGTLRFRRIPFDPHTDESIYADAEDFDFSEAQRIFGEQSDPARSLVNIQKKVQDLVQEMHAKRAEFAKTNPVQKYISEDPDLKQSELSWFGSYAFSSIECVPSSDAGPSPHPMFLSAFTAVNAVLGDGECAGYVDTLPDEKPKSDDQVEKPDGSEEESGNKEPTFSEDDYANMSSGDQDVVKTMGNVGREKAKVPTPNMAVTDKLEGLMTDEDKALMNSVEVSGNAVREAVFELDAIEGVGFAVGGFTLVYDILYENHNRSVDGWKIAGDIVGFIPVVGQFGQVTFQGIDMAVHGDKNSWDWAGLIIPVIGIVRTWISNWSNLHPYKAVVNNMKQTTQQVLKETAPPKVIEAALDFRLQHAEDYLQVVLDLMVSRFDYDLKRHTTSNPASVMDLMLLRGPLRNLTLELEHSQDFRIIQAFREVFQRTKGFSVTDGHILWDGKQIAITELPFHSIGEPGLYTDRIGYNRLFTADTMQKGLDNVTATLDAVVQVIIEKTLTCIGDQKAGPLPGKKADLVTKQPGFGKVGTYTYADTHTWWRYFTKDEIIRGYWLSEGWASFQRGDLYTMLDRLMTRNIVEVVTMSCKEFLAGLIIQRKAIIHGVIEEMQKTDKELKKKIDEVKTKLKKEYKWSLPGSLMADMITPYGFIAEAIRAKHFTDDLHRLNAIESAADTEIKSAMAIGNVQKVYNQLYPKVVKRFQSFEQRFIVNIEKKKDHEDAKQNLLALFQSGKPPADVHAGIDQHLGHLQTLDYQRKVDQLRGQCVHTLDIVSGQVLFFVHGERADSLFRRLSYKQSKILKECETVSNVLRDVIKKHQKNIEKQNSTVKFILGHLADLLESFAALPRSRSTSEVKKQCAYIIAKVQEAQKKWDTLFTALWQSQIREGVQPYTGPYDRYGNQLKTLIGQSDSKAIESQVHDILRGLHAEAQADSSLFAKHRLHPAPYARYMLTTPFQSAALDKQSELDLFVRQRTCLEGFRALLSKGADSFSGIKPRTVTVGSFIKGARLTRMPLWMPTKPPEDLGFQPEKNNGKATGRTPMPLISKELDKYTGKLFPQSTYFYEMTVDKKKVEAIGGIQAFVNIVCSGHPMMEAGLGSPLARNFYPDTGSFVIKNDSYTPYKALDSCVSLMDANLEAGFRVTGLIRIPYVAGKPDMNADVDTLNKEINEMAKKYVPVSVAVDPKKAAEPETSFSFDKVVQGGDGQCALWMLHRHYGQKQRAMIDSSGVSTVKRTNHDIFHDFKQLFLVFPDDVTVSHAGKDMVHNTQVFFYDEKGDGKTVFSDGTNSTFVDGDFQERAQRDPKFHLTGAVPKNAIPLTEYNQQREGWEIIVGLFGLQALGILRTIGAVGKLLSLIGLTSKHVTLPLIQGEWNRKSDSPIKIDSKEWDRYHKANKLYTKVFGAITWYVKDKKTREKVEQENIAISKFSLGDEQQGMYYCLHAIDQNDAGDYLVTFLSSDTFETRIRRDVVTNVGGAFEGVDLVNQQKEVSPVGKSSDKKNQLPVSKIKVGDNFAKLCNPETVPPQVAPPWIYQNRTTPPPSFPGLTVSAEYDWKSFDVHYPVTIDGDSSITNQNLLAHCRNITPVASMQYGTISCVISSPKAKVAMPKIITAPEASAFLLHQLMEKPVAVEKTDDKGKDTVVTIEPGSDVYDLALAFDFQNAQNAGTLSVLKSVYDQFMPVKQAVEAVQEKQKKDQLDSIQKAVDGEAKAAFAARRNMQNLLKEALATGANVRPDGTEPSVVTVKISHGKKRTDNGIHIIKTQNVSFTSDKKTGTYAVVVFKDLPKDLRLDSRDIVAFGGDKQSVFSDGTSQAEVVGGYNNVFYLSKAFGRDWADKKDVEVQLISQPLVVTPAPPSS